MSKHTGSCLCGKIRLEIAGELRPVLYCHCSQCRKQTGHHYAATACDNEALSITGEEYLKWYRASPNAGRGFCSNCGSALLWKHDDASYTSVMAGCLDKPTGLTEDKHIFVADKGDYYEITDGLEQLAQY